MFVFFFFNKNCFLKKRALGSVPQKGELQALSYQEETGGVITPDAATENAREKTGKVGAGKGSGYFMEEVGGPSEHGGPLSHCPGLS